MSEPIDPGAGYRLLKAGEVFRQGDEVKDAISYSLWYLVPPAHFGKAVRPSPSASFPEGYYRRKIAAEDRWIPMKAFGPPPHEVVKVFDAARKIATIAVDNKLNPCFTHWKPIRLDDDPPEPEVRTEKDAFGDWYVLNFRPTGNSWNDARKCWLAGYDCGRKEQK